MRTLAFLALLSAALIPIEADSQPYAEAQDSPVFSPKTFFSGKTVGEGTLKVTFAGAKHTHVVGDGQVESDGTLVLVQRVIEGNKPPRDRTWRIRPAGGGLFTGTLTDAEGPVHASVRGNLLSIQYVAEGGVDIEQRLYLQPGGQVATNFLTAKKFGVPVGHLTEIIRRVRGQ